MASGPSLCAEDAKLVRQWRKETGGTVCVVNTTFRMAPWADVLYACDGGWWRVYGDEVLEKFQGRKYCYADISRKYNATKINGIAGVGGLNPKPDHINTGGNSGHQAIHLARNEGAKRVILLGFDFAFTGGQAHWHGNHPQPLGNAGSIKTWVPHMRKLAADLKAEGVEVINSSRHTALDCFERRDLTDALEC